MNVRFLRVRDLVDGLPILTGRHDDSPRTCGPIPLVDGGQDHKGHELWAGATILLVLPACFLGVLVGFGLYLVLLQACDAVAGAIYL